MSPEIVHLKDMEAGTSVLQFPFFSWLSWLWGSASLLLGIDATERPRLGWLRTRWSWAAKNCTSQHYGEQVGEERLGSGSGCYRSLMLLEWVLLPVAVLSPNLTCLPLCSTAAALWGRFCGNFRKTGACHLGEGQEAALTGWVYLFLFYFAFLWSFSKRALWTLRNEIFKYRMVPGNRLIQK